jgi:hypothetical protein
VGEAEDKVVAEEEVAVEDEPLMILVRPSVMHRENAKVKRMR